MLVEAIPQYFLRDFAIEKNPLQSPLHSYAYGIAIVNSGSYLEHGFLDQRGFASHPTESHSLIIKL